MSTGVIDITEGMSIGGSIIITDGTFIGPKGPASKHGNTIGGSVSSFSGASISGITNSGNGGTSGIGISKASSTSSVSGS